MATKLKTKRLAKPTRKTEVRSRLARTSRKAGVTTAKNGKAVNGKRASLLSKKSTLNQQEQLRKEREQVESELVSLRLELQEAPETTGDEVDLNVYERERTLSLVSAYERRLEEIDAALLAAQKGQYGICERCGKPIDPERLKIFPETRLCVSCKNEVEKEARLMRL